MAHPTVQIPTITVGTRHTNFASLDLTVEGLAAGGMGLVVWGPNAAQGNRMRALKLLKPERVAAAAHSPQQRRAIERQFEDEALVWCHLWPHQCVVTATGLTRLVALGDLPVLSLTYAPQGSLRDVLRHGRQQRTHPPLRAALAWAVHIASALAHIHQPDPAHDRPAPLVHCDLKPENVLFDEDGWAQLTDLGLTRTYAALAPEAADPLILSREGTSAVAASGVTPHQAEVARLRAVLRAAGALQPDPSAAGGAATAEAGLFATRTLRIPSSTAASAGGAAAIGSRSPVARTLPYMAPEQWQGLDAAVPATDLYAFGVLLYELFAGTEAPYPFPFDPSPYLRDPAISAQAHSIGYQPALLAWYSAHTALGGPAHHLTDPDVAEAALQSGPLADLARGGDSADRGVSRATLYQLDELITACLARDPAARPTTQEVQQRLARLTTDSCGIEPLQSPEPLRSTPRSEGVFWGNLGVTYSNLDREQEAIAAKRRATQHDPTHPGRWINLGASLDNLGQEENRQAAIAEAADRPAQEVTSLLAAAYQHFEEALTAYQEADACLTPEILAADPLRPVRIATNRANTLGNLGRYAEAIVAEQRALALRPEKHNTRFNLALHYARWSQVPDTTPAERLERLRAAEREIQTVLAAAPSFTQARAFAADIIRALADPTHRFQG